MEWLRTRGYAGIVQTSWSNKITREINPGDIVIGNIPIYVIEQILARGGRVILIGVPGWPGKHRNDTIRDLTAEEMETKKTYLTEVTKLEMHRIKF